MINSKKKMGCFNSGTVVDNQENPNNEQEENKKTELNKDLATDVNKNKNSKKDENKTSKEEKPKKNEKTKTNAEISFPKDQFYIKESVNEEHKRKALTGMTILENVKEFIPEDVSRDYIKEMVENALGDSIERDITKYKKGKNFTPDQVEGIIDLLFNIVQKNENTENQVEDERLRGLKLKIGFYDLDRDILLKTVYKGRKPTEKELDDKIKELSGGCNVKILMIEFQD